MSKQSSPPSLKMLDIDSVALRIEAKYFPELKRKRSGKRSKKASIKSKTA